VSWRDTPLVGFVSKEDREGDQHNLTVTCPR
jgi:hypothetical protein